MKKLLLRAIAFLFTFIVTLSPVGAASQYQSVEDEIFTLQKGWIQEMIQTLEIDTTMGVHQMGDMVFSVKFGTSTATGSVALTLDKLDVTLDGKNGNTEVFYRGKLGFEVKSMDYRYDEKSNEYKKIPTQNAGEIRFSITLIQASGSTYARLEALDASISGEEMTREELEGLLEKARKYIGKMYKLPGTTSLNLKPENTREIFQRGANILSSQPLFSVVKKEKDETYRLRLRADTMKALGMNMRSVNTGVFTYKNTNSKKELRLSPRRNAKTNYTILSEINGVYALTGKNYNKTKYSTVDRTFSLTKEAFSLRSKSQYSTLSADWKFGQLTIDHVTPGTKYSSGQSFHVEGRLMPNLRDIDLLFTYDDKKVGTFSSAKGSNGIVSYRGNFVFGADLWNLILDMNGTYTETKGDYTILPPKLYEILD